MVNEKTTQILDSAAYQALRTGVAVQERPDAGALLLTGADRSDFLQRMTTNDVAALSPGESTVTVLTSPVAKILFVFTVVCRSENLLLLPARGETADLARYLRSQIFFMDQVKLQDQSEQLVRLRIMGPDAERALTRAGFAAAVTADETWQAVDGILFVNQQRYDLPGYECVVPAERHADFMQRMTAQGAVSAHHDDVTARRVELGRPAPGYELTEEYTPLETGLKWVCAENKGCYTGQEIIARQITYDKVTRVLVGLRSDSPLVDGATVKSEAQPIGTVTTAAYSPEAGAPVALAVVKRSYALPGTQVSVDGAAAQIMALPLLAESGQDG